MEANRENIESRMDFAPYTDKGLEVRADPGLNYNLPLLPGTTRLSSEEVIGHGGQWTLNNCTPFHMIGIILSAMLCIKLLANQ